MTNPTSNFGWQMPTSTDLVTDLPADFEVFGQAVDTSLADLKGGTSGQILSKASATDMDFTWVTTDDANAIQNAIVDAKGDLIAATANDTPARLAVGTNTAVLTADSTAATGLVWEGVWTNFTPSWTGLVVGNGTQVARYRKVGKTVDVYVKFTFGSTSVMGAINYFALPFNLATTSNGFSTTGVLEDVGVNAYGIGAEFNSNNLILSVVSSNLTYSYINRVTSTVPFTWGTTDIFWLQIRYEAA
jgi:hypothetical protein